MLSFSQVKNHYLKLTNGNKRLIYIIIQAPRWTSLVNHGVGGGGG